MSIQNKAVSFIKRLISRRTAIAVSVALIAAGAANAGDAGGEGIKVHGDWVVIVTNPDGSIAQERYFKNALAGSGNFLLRSLLVADSSINLRPDDSPAWDILAFTTGVRTAPECVALTSDETLLVDGPKAISPLNAVTEYDTPPNKITLTRSFSLSPFCVTGNSYEINEVSTYFSILRWNLHHSVQFDESLTFTSKVLAPAITGILPEQGVTLKVILGFE